MPMLIYCLQTCLEKLTQADRASVPPFFSLILLYRIKFLQVVI